MAINVVDAAAVAAPVAIMVMMLFVVGGDVAASGR